VSANRAYDIRTFVFESSGLPPKSFCSDLLEFGTLGRIPESACESSAYRQRWISRIAEDGSIEIEFAYHNGDEAVLKAKLDTSSTAC
jgi:hypothetical protein